MHDVQFATLISNVHKKSGIIPFIYDKFKTTEQEISPQKPAWLPFIKITLSTQHSVNGAAVFVWLHLTPMILVVLCTTVILGDCIMREFNVFCNIYNACSI